MEVKIRHFLHLLFSSHPLPLFSFFLAQVQLPVAFFYHPQFFLDVLVQQPTVFASLVQVSISPIPTSTSPSLAQVSVFPALALIFLALAFAFLRQLKSFSSIHLMQPNFFFHPLQKLL